MSCASMTMEMLGWNITKKLDQDVDHIWHALLGLDRLNIRLNNQDSMVARTEK